MRTHDLAPTQRGEFARNDLGGAALPGGSAGVALGFERVRDALMLINRKTGDDTWFQTVEADAEQQRAVARDPSLDPAAGGAAVEGLLKKHQDRLQRNAVGGREGEARESIKANARFVNEEVERRLRELFLYRVNELGVPETLQLLEDYGKHLQSEAEKASRWTRHGADESGVEVPTGRGPATAQLADPPAGADGCSRGIARAPSTTPSDTSRTSTPSTPARRFTTV